MDELTARVKAALEAAADNGYHFEGRTDVEVALDMVTYCPDFDRQEVEDIVPILNNLRKPTEGK